MPYPNEHAARVRNPDLFEPNSFRSKELKDGVRFLLGKLVNGNGSMVVQAYRFSVDRFTVEQAKQWLVDNKVHAIKFEAAIKEGEMKQSNTLEHVGVLGMKWGVRRGSSRTSRRGKIVPASTSVRGKTVSKTSQRSQLFRNKSKKINPSDDFKKVSQLKKKKIDEMSNEEISTVIKRMDLQKRYKDVNPSKLKAGTKAAGKTLGTLGQLSAGVATIAALATVGQKLFKKLNTPSLLKNVRQ